MAGAFASLKVGDLLFLDDVEYLASGRRRLRAGGDTWTEWLLVPLGTRASDAIRDRRHRRVSHAVGKGQHLWAPCGTPEGFTPDALEEAKSFRLGGRDYRVTSRHAVEVVEMHGDLGDSDLGERFDVVELRGGQKTLRIAWNTSGTGAMLGRRIGDHDLVRWSREAGGKLASRVRNGTAASGAKRKKGIPTDKSTTAAVANHAGWISAVAVILTIVALQSCGDRQCRQQYNAATGTYDTVCERGLRSGGGRNHGGWGGK